MTSPAFVPAPGNNPINSTFNIVYAGNSLIFGTQMTDGMTLPKLVAMSYPISGSGAATTNCATSGWTWAQMQTQGDAARVDAAWVAGKINVLVLWETTNSISVYASGGNTTTSPQLAFNDAQTFIADRRTGATSGGGGHPWIIIVLTTLPRQNYPDAQQSDNDTFNVNLLAADALMKSNMVSLGADYILDVRHTGSPYALPDYLPATFATLGNLWANNAPGRVHLSNIGQQIIQGYVSAMLASIRIAPHQ